MLMEIIQHGVSVAAPAAGLWAAWEWWKSSKVQVDPRWALPGTGGHIEPVIAELRNMELHCATLTAFQTTSSLNWKAAGWAMTGNRAAGWPFDSDP